MAMMALMTKRVSIAEARNHFTELVRAAEGGAVVEVQRRGKVAVIVVSAQRYDRLTAARPSFAEALASFLEGRDRRHALRQKDLAGLRDRSPGRPVRR